MTWNFFDMIGTGLQMILLWRQPQQKYGSLRFIHLYSNSTEMCPSQQLIIFWPRPHWTFPKMKENTHRTVFWQETATNIKICRQVTSTEDLLLRIPVPWCECLHHHTPLQPLCIEWSGSWPLLHWLLSHSFPHNIYVAPCKLLTARRNELWP